MKSSVSPIGRGVVYASITLICFIFTADCFAASKTLSVCISTVNGEVTARRRCKANETRLDISALQAIADGKTYFNDQVISVAGPQGPAGPKGETGAQGPTGPMGPRGPMGEPGLKGDQGEKGATGETGPQGIQGAQGPQGVPGPEGVTGYQIVSNELTLQPQGVAGSQAVFCPDGKVALGGGGVGIGGNLDNFRMLNSFPVTDGLRAGWQVRFINEGTHVRKFVVYAVCSKVTA